MKSKKQIKPVWPYFILIVISIFLLIRAFYGFCWTDEAFYVSTAERFLRGDRFISDEWYISQLPSIFIMPILAVYKGIFHTLDGIYLVLRLLYVLFQLMISMCAFYIFNLNKKNIWGNLCGAIAILLYCRANIITLSYYSIIFMSYLLTIILIYDYICRKQSYFKAFFIGISLSFTIIINPYLVVIYIIGVTVVIVSNILTKGRNPEIKKWCSLLLESFIGIAPCAFLFCTIIMSNHNNITDILNNITGMADPQYNIGKNFGYKLFEPFIDMAKRFKFTFIISILSCLYTIAALRKKHMLSGIEKDVLWVVNFVVFLINCYVIKNWSGGVLVALAIFGIQAFLLTDLKDWKIFIYIYCAGLLLAYFMNFSSDTRFCAMTIGFAVSACASCFFICNFITERKKRRNKTCNLMLWTGYATLAITLILTCLFRIINVYRDADLYKLNTRITDGPATGIYTTYEHWDQYYDVMETVKKYCNRDGTLFISAWCPWAYLCTDMMCGAYTTWSIRFGESEERLKQYYRIHPDRIPNMVLVLNDEIGNFNAIWDNEAPHLYPQKDNKRETSFLWEYMNKKEYEKISVDCGTLYIRMDKE